MRNDKPAVVDLSEMQHDHSSAEQGGVIARTLYLSGYVGVVDEDVDCMVWVVPTDVTATLPEDLVGTEWYAETAPAADTTFTVYKNGTSLGTATFAASSHTPTYTFTTATGFTGGDRLKLRTPATPTTLAGLSATFAAELT